MSDSLMLYLAVLTLLYAALLRLKELRVSKINQHQLESNGYSRKDDKLSYLNMFCLHASFFVASFLELTYLPLFSNYPIQISAFLLFIFAQIVRFCALRSLGVFWNTNIMSADANAKFIQSGPYKYIRHPNYLAVILEFLSIPMIAGAWRTALVYTIWNAFVLKKRIVEEEAELFKIPEYREIMDHKKRFIPGVY
jgi:methyltransferase